MASALLCDPSINIFPNYPEMESAYVAHLSSIGAPESQPNAKNIGSFLTQEIQKAREHIKLSLDRATNVKGFDVNRITEVENAIKLISERLSALEMKMNQFDLTSPRKTPQPAAASEDDDDDDLFSMNSEDERKVERLKAERSANSATVTSQKTGPVAKSTVVLDIKPWDDETDLEKLVTLVRGIQMDGLLWGVHKFQPVAYGIKKVQIGCVIEDDKVDLEPLEEAITAFEDYVQSVDVVAFNKL